MIRKSDKDSLRIESFVFHILLKDEESPRYLDEVRLTQVQRGFFAKWLRDGIQHMIEYELIPSEEYSHGPFHQATDHMASEGFIEYSKSIANEFKTYHKGSSSDGILVFCESSMESGRLLFMVKVDYKDTFQYNTKDEDGRIIGVLTAVKNPIVDDFQAIQKIAAVNLSSTYEWDIMAYDKFYKSEKKIASYFKSFLHVREKEADSTLTRRALGTVTSWYKANHPTTDPGQNASDFKGRAYEYLSQNSLFDAQEFIKYVVLDKDSTRRQLAFSSLNTALEDAELAGRVFETRPNSLPKSQVRSVWETPTHLKITFIGSPNSHGLLKEDLPDGNSRIVILTPKVTIK